MLESGLVLGMSAMHVGVPLTDLVAWTIVVALLVAPVQLDDRRRQRLIEAAARNTAEPEGTKARPLAEPVPSNLPLKSVVVVPATTRLSAVEQWQAVSQLVSAGTERALAVARNQQAIRRELDALDFTLENLRRELSAVMTMPALTRGAELVPVRIAGRPQALAA